MFLQVEVAIVGDTRLLVVLFFEFGTVVGAGGEIVTRLLEDDELALLQCCLDLFDFIRLFGKLVLNCEHLSLKIL